VKPCILKYPTAKWNCLMPENLVEFIKVPFFFVQSPYDPIAIGDIL